MEPLDIDMEFVQAQAAANQRTRVACATMLEPARQAIYERWLDAAVESGQLTLPDYETTPERYKAVQWHPRSLAWVDPREELATPATRPALSDGTAGAL